MPVPLARSRRIARSTAFETGGRPYSFALGLGTLQASPDSILDYCPLEFGKYPQHLEQSFAGGGRGVQGLLMEKDGEWLDPGTASTSGRTDPAMAAVGEIDRTKDRSG